MKNFKLFIRVYIRPSLYTPADQSNPSTGLASGATGNCAPCTSIGLLVTDIDGVTCRPTCPTGTIQGSTTTVPIVPTLNCVAVCPPGFAPQGSTICTQCPNGSPLVSKDGTTCLSQCPFGQIATTVTQPLVNTPPTANANPNACVQIY